MTPTQKTNILSGVVAALGLLSVAVLEMAYTPAGESGYQYFATCAAIFVGGLLRWYMFFEGTALGAYNQKDARIALRLSIILAVGLFLYGVFLAVAGEFSWHLFSLFALVNLGLVFAEWVFGRRTSYVKPEIQIQLESELDARTSELDSIRATLETKTAELDNLRNVTTDLRMKSAEQEEKIRRTQNRVSELEAVVSESMPIVEAVRDTSVLLKDSAGYFKVCSCGKRNDVGNRGKSLRCDCGVLLWEKPETE